MFDYVNFRIITIKSQHSAHLEQTLASLLSDNDQRILSAVADARKEEKRKAEQSREQLTLELHEQKCLAIEDEIKKTKEVEHKVEQLRMVSCFKPRW